MNQMRVLLTLAAALIASPAVAEEINLMCRGRAETIEYGDTDLITGQEDVVRLRITAPTGTAELPRLIGGRNHKSLSMKDIKASEAEVTGKIWYGRIGNAKMRIDRVTGLVSIRGPEGNFSGTCKPFDPAAAPKPLF